LARYLGSLSSLTPPRPSLLLSVFLPGLLTVGEDPLSPLRLSRYKAKYIKEIGAPLDNQLQAKTQIGNIDRSIDQAVNHRSFLPFLKRNRIKVASSSIFVFSTPTHTTSTHFATILPPTLILPPPALSFC
jgi:hypothetical protein